MSGGPKPPRLAVWLLGKLYSGSEGTEALGDLHEAFLDRADREGGLRARWWYWGEAARLCSASIRSVRTLRGISGDLRYASRTLRRSPGLTAVALLSLALGIGANTAIFTVVNAILLRPLPVEDAGTLYDIFTLDGSNPNNDLIPVSVPNYHDIRDAVTTLESVVAVANAGMGLQIGDEDPQGVGGQLVTGNYFETLGVRPHVGRLIRSTDDTVEGIGAVAVLSHTIWMRLFGGDPSVVGTTVRLNGQPMEVIGVTPPGFKGTRTLASPDRIWVPMSETFRMISPGARIFFEARRALPYALFGRLAEGVEPEVAQAELTAIAARLEEAYPEDNNSRTLVMVPTLDAAVGINQRAILTRSSGMLMSVVGLVLLIACANLANLLLARSAARSRELALRASLGAGRWLLVRQMLVESLVLASVGGAVGVGLAHWGSEFLLGLASNVIPTNAVVLDLDLRVLGFAGAMTIGTGLLFGLIPALRASSPDVHELLKEGARGGAGLARSPLRSSLVMAEVAFAVVGLFGAGLFIRSVQEAQREDFGYEIGGLGVVPVSLGGGLGPAEAVVFMTSAQEAAATVPGVDAAGFGAGTPLNAVPVRTLVPEDDTDPDRASSFVGTMAVMPEYFPVLGLRPIEGRLLEPSDYVDGSEPVAVVNEALAQRYWPDESALGRRYAFFADSVVRTVVGVVPSVSFGDLGGPESPTAYMPYTQWFQGGGLLHVRVRGDAPVALAAVRDRLLELDPNRTVQAPTTVEEILRQSLWARRTGAGLVGGFGIVALVLAVIGIHAVMSYVSLQRRREIGIRMALGAEASDVLWMVVRQGMGLVVGGLVVGTGVALAAGWFVRSLLYEVRPTDPVTVIGVSVVLTGVAFIACVLPAFRSTRMSPVRVLKE